MDRAEELYQDGLPLQVSCPDKSVFKHIPSERWDSLTEIEQQKETVGRIVVVTGEKLDGDDDITFSEAGLTAVGGIMSRQISINGTLLVSLNSLSARHLIQDCLLSQISLSNLNGANVCLRQSAVIL